MGKKLPGKLIGNRYLELKAPGTTVNGKAKGGVYRDLGMKIENIKSDARRLAKIKARGQKEKEE